MRKADANQPQRAVGTCPCTAGARTVTSMSRSATMQSRPSPVRQSICARCIALLVCATWHPRSSPGAGWLPRGRIRVRSTHRGQSPNKQKQVLGALPDPSTSKCIPKRKPRRIVSNASALTRRGVRPSVGMSQRDCHACGICLKHRVTLHLPCDSEYSRTPVTPMATASYANGYSYKYSKLKASPIGHRSFYRGHDI